MLLMHSHNHTDFPPINNNEQPFHSVHSPNKHSNNTSPYPTLRPSSNSSIYACSSSRPSRELAPISILSAASSISTTPSLPFIKSHFVHFVRLPFQRRIVVHVLRRHHAPLLRFPRFPVSLRTQIISRRVRALHGRFIHFLRHFSLRLLHYGSFPDSAVTASFVDDHSSPREIERNRDWLLRITHNRGNPPAIAAGTPFCRRLPRFFGRSSGR